MGDKKQMKKIINMVLLSVFTFTLLMSMLHVDRFSESMTIENYDNEGLSLII